METWHYSINELKLFENSLVCADLLFESKGSVQTRLQTQQQKKPTSFVYINE